jgi:hypothetical protein
VSLDNFHTTNPDELTQDDVADEIAEWMQEDFGQAVAEGMANTGDGDNPDDEHEVVGTIDTDGNLDTEGEALRNVSQGYIEEGVPVLVPTNYENEDGETVHADAEVMVEPGTRDSSGLSLTNSRVRSTTNLRRLLTCLLTTKSNGIATFRPTLFRKSRLVRFRRPRFQSDHYILTSSSSSQETRGSGV